MMKRIAVLLGLTCIMQVSVPAGKNINGVNVLMTLEELAHPDYSAVMVVDMQNEMVSTEGQCSRPDRSIPPDPSKHEVVSHLKETTLNLQKLLAAARQLELPITYAEYIHEDKDGNMLVNGPEYWTHRNGEWVLSIVEGTWGSRTIDELTPRKGDIMIRKNYSDAFHDSTLAEQLNDKGVRCLLVTGIAAGGCVFATAMGAMEDGFYPVMITDCMDQSKISHDFMEGRWPKFTSEQVISTWQKMKAHSSSSRSKPEQE